MISFLKFFLIHCVKLYKFFLSPFLPISCRFSPTCSIYAIEAIKKHNLAKAFKLIILRILKCNPFFKGGYDPIL